jgi:anthranilate phosphoribosyltransferase
MTLPPANALQSAILKLALHEPLTGGDAEAAFDVIMTGKATEVQIAAILSAMRAAGETSDQVAGVVRAMRSAMIQLPASKPDELVDTCGTGGGVVPTFNISTAAAFVAAGAGIRIAKHGNRSFTTRCGSADVLQALGVQIEVPVEVMARALESAGIVFMFAPLMHPAMRYVGAVRRELAIPSVMNIVGPLANPAHAGAQVVGVADVERAPILAGALSALGTRHALIVHGEPGLDEISPLGPTHVVEVKGGKTSEWTINPADFGFGKGSAAELKGSQPEENARIIEAILGGKGNRTSREAVILNAAGAIYVGGGTSNFGDAVGAAGAAIESGGALRALEALREAYST